MHNHYLTSCYTLKRTLRKAFYRCPIGDMRTPMLLEGLEGDIDCDKQRWANYTYTVTPEIHWVVYIETTANLRYVGWLLDLITSKQYKRLLAKALCGGK